MAMINLRCPMDNKDRANGDLKPGDRVMIREWVKQKAFVKQRIGAMGMSMTEMVAEQETSDETTRVQPNQRFFGDVLEILAVDYPWAVCDLHSVQGPSDYTRARITLNLTDFNCEKATPEYVTAVMSGAPRPAPIQPKEPEPAHILVASVNVTGLDKIARTLLLGAMLGLLLWALWTFQ